MRTMTESQFDDVINVHSKAHPPHIPLPYRVPSRLGGVGVSQGT